MKTATERMTITPMDRITRARTQFLVIDDINTRFFGALVMKLGIQITPCGTACTNGRWIRFDPEFMATLTDAQLRGVLAHEVWHCVRGHVKHIGSRQPFLWNGAGDLHINYELSKLGFEFPSGLLMPGVEPFEKYPVGLTTYEYYNMLVDDCPIPEPDEMMWGTFEAEPQDGDPQSGGAGAGAGGEDGEAEVVGASADPVDWSTEAAMAAHAVGRGAAGGDLDLLLEDILPRNDVSWQEELADFTVATVGSGEYSWQRFDRRHAWSGTYLPGLYSEELKDCVIAVDCSGSINRDLLKKFCGQVQSIMEAWPNAQVTILYHDTRVTRVQQWSPMDGPLKMEPHGGGGTSHRCVFGWLDKHMPGGLEFLVCFTDLYTEFPTKKPTYPVLWLSDGSTNAPFGRVIDMRENT